MHQIVKCGKGVELVDEAPVDEAPVGLYTKLRKTRTFVNGCHAKITLWKTFKSCTSYCGCLYQYH